MGITALVRFGATREVAKFDAPDVQEIERGLPVVVQSRRGVEMGTVLETLIARSGLVAGSDDEPATTSGPILRIATGADLSTSERLRGECEAEFEQWRDRIRGWKLELELIDLEWTLDHKTLILYVLNARGDGCTKLALYAAAAGLGPIEVQPLGDEEPRSSQGGGCGSGGCGCHT
jgi:cell fate regulator YaaT (PSP1 superfamily)